MKGLKTVKMPKAPKGLSLDKVMKAPKLGKVNALKPQNVGGKMPTLKDLKVPPGGLMNKGLRQNYGKVPGLNT